MTEARERFISDDDECRLRDRPTIWDAILIWQSLLVAGGVL